MTPRQNAHSAFLMGSKVMPMLLLRRSHFEQQGSLMMEEGLLQTSEPSRLASCLNMHAKSLQSCPTSGNPWTVAHQASLSMGVLQVRILESAAWGREDPGNPPYPRIEPMSPTASVGRLFTTEPRGKPPLFKHTEHYIHNSPHFSPEGLVPQYLFRPGTLGHYQLRSNLDSIFQICSSVSLFTIEHAQCRRIVKFLFNLTVDCTQT